MSPRRAARASRCPSHTTSTRVLSGEASASRAFRSLLRVEAGAESEPG